MSGRSNESVSPLSVTTGKVKSSLTLSEQGRAVVAREVHILKAAGSNPAPATNGGMAEWLKASVLKTETRKSRGFKPLSLRQIITMGG